MRLQEVVRSARVLSEREHDPSAWPGPHDVLVFELRPGSGVRGGIDHFGFRLTSPDDAAAALEEARAAGGTILRHGEHGPGEPYLYVADPDGHEIEIWYETAVA